MIEKIKSSFLGFAIGDALGVPVEFLSRTEIAKDPVTDMRGNGTHNQLRGTWSDDTSLLLCVAENIAEKGDARTLGNRFVRWRNEAYLTANDQVFDCGMATQNAISRLQTGVDASESGGTGEDSNGNGSLMRILPLAFSMQGRDDIDILAECRANSRVTHGHFRSFFSCYLLVKFAMKLMKAGTKQDAYMEFRREALNFIRRNGFDKNEIQRFSRIITNDISECPENLVYSTGYVLHTLEAAIWCIMTTNSFREAVLKAVNLGEDTDTTGAITGGLAGLIYDQSTFPQEWLETLVRGKLVEEIALKFHESL